MLKETKQETLLKRMKGDKMKNKIILTIIFLILISTLVLAVRLSTREETETEFQRYKAEREDNISRFVNTLKYASDKVCKFNYHSEEVSCLVDYFFTVENGTVYTVSLRDGASVEEDEQIILNHAWNMIEQRTVVDEFSYVERVINGTLVDAVFENRTRGR